MPNRTHLGDSGIAVLEWQRFLVRSGLLSASEVDGIHGPITESASVLYERMHPADRPLPMSMAERVRIFGGFAFVPAPRPARDIALPNGRVFHDEGDPEAIRITDGWDIKNIVSVHIPQLRGIVGAPESCRVPFHKLVAQMLIDLWQAWDDAGLVPRVLQFSGTLCERFVRGAPGLLSEHAFGTAIDLNAGFLPRGKPDVGQRGSMIELAAIAEPLGWFWGQNFDTPDPMHLAVRELR